MSGRWILAVLLGSISFSSGCLQPGQVAGRRHPVTLSACQSAVPYVVVLEDWKAEQSRRLQRREAASDAALMADDEFLAEYRVQGGHRTPTVAYYPGYPHVAVFKREGHEPLLVGPFTPPARVEVCFPGCEATASDGAGVRDVRDQEPR